MHQRDRQRLHELLGFQGDVTDQGWRVIAPSPGTALPEPAPLFTKLDDAVADEMAAKLGTGDGGGRRQSGKA